MTGPCTTSLIPLLRADATIAPGSDALVYVEEQEFLFRGIQADTFRHFLNCLDGRSTLDAIALDCEISLDIATGLARELIRCGLVVDLARTPQDVSPDQLARVCRLLFPHWKRRLFSHPLWVHLATGKAPRSHFLGWLLESFHFIDGINARLPIVISSCPDPNVRRLFVKHYSEEYDHGHFFLRSLERLGVAPDVAIASTPLPTTEAILNYMRRAGRNDFLQYAVCSGFLESTGEDRLKAKTFFDHLQQHYDPTVTGAIEPLLAHVNLDEAYAHNSLMEATFVLAGHVSVQRASTALDTGANLVQLLELWSTDIERTYELPLPRPDVAPYRVSRK